MPDSQFYCGHRERLRQKFLDDKLADYEKLELLLGYVVPRCDMRPVAHALLKHFGSISLVLTASIEDLQKIPGIGHNTAVFLKLIHQIIIDGYRGTMDTRPIFHDINVLKNYCKWSLANKSVEEFHVLYMDNDYHLLQDEKHSSGTFDFTNIYIREIIKKVLQLNATGVILVHNHPISDSGFSDADIKTTSKLQKLFYDLDIILYDHLLVSKYSIWSARDCGIIKD